MAFRAPCDLALVSLSHLLVCQLHLFSTHCPSLCSLSTGSLGPLSALAPAGPVACPCSLLSEAGTAHPVTLFHFSWLDSFGVNASFHPEFPEFTTWP